MIELKIPNDPLVMSAVADWLYRESGADGLPLQTETRTIPEGAKFEVVAIHGGPAPSVVEETPPEGDGPSAASAFGGESAPPAPPAPASQVADSLAAGNGAQVPLDKRGFPWDERIHARTKATLQDGTWRKKRGVEDPLVESVEAEYRAAGFGTPSTAPAPAPASAPPAITFATLLQRITGDQVPQERVMEVLNAHGIAAIPVLGSRPDLVPDIFAELFPNG